MKLLHCVTDDKFIDGAIGLFDSDIRHLNEYVLFSESESESFQYIRSRSVYQIPTSQFLNKCKDFDVVVLHSLYCIPTSLIYKIPHGIKVVWFAWGWDLYDGSNPLIKLNLYAPQTESIRKKFFSTNNFIRKCYSNYLNHISYKHKLNALKRVDYFSGVFPYEFNLLKSVHKDFKAKQLDFYYGSIDFFIKDQIDTDINNDMSNIIIGNSAHLTNNHIDVIDALSKQDLNSIHKIIIPLSYGANNTYRDIVSVTASEKLTPSVETLREFLPINTYLHLVSNCRSAIFGHERQQATDNIFMQLLSGARVFMSETSLAYKYLKSIGLHIYSIQSDMELVSVPLSYNRIIENRRILAEYYSCTSLVNRILLINNTLSQD